MKNGLQGEGVGGWGRGRGLGLGIGDAIGKAAILLRIVEGRGCCWGGGYQERQHQLARRNTRCQGCMVFLGK